MVTSAPSRNWLSSNQRDVHDVAGFESIILIARSGWSPLSLSHDSTDTEEITGGAVGAEVGGGVVASADCGASCGAFCATPERSDWARSRSVAGVRTIHVDQTAPTRKTTAAKISVGLVGSMVRPCCADFCPAPSPGCPGHWGATGATGCWACSWAR